MAASSVLVDPRDYRSFCFRGEGRANFVISAKCERSGLRIVWRFAKQRKSGCLTVKAKSEVVSNYMSRLVAPFFSEEYLVSPQMVHFRVEDVHQLAKIPSLQANLKVENFEDLKSFPAEMSFLPLKSVPKNCTRLSALEMLDATRIPKDFGVFHGPTITVEIKPKQGFYQHHCGFNLAHCNNCVLQIEKCSSEAFDTMYDFCPLDLYSGDFSRMRSAVEALFRVPHRNLRVFVNGDVVHSDESLLEWGRMDRTFFPDGSATTSELIDALCCSLAGQDSPDFPFDLAPRSVLGEILAAQKVDTIGIAEAHIIYSQLPPNVQGQLKNKSSALSKRTLSLLRESDPRSLLEQYLLAATMKDCSIMASLRLIPPDEAARAAGLGTVVRIGTVFFAISVKIVDLDPKSAKNLVNAFERFNAGAALLAEEPHLRRPCVSSSGFGETV